MKMVTKTMIKGNMNCTVCVTWIMASLVSAIACGCDIRICTKVTIPVRIGRIWVGSGSPNEICQAVLKMVNQLRSMLGMLVS